MENQVGFSYQILGSKDLYIVSSQCIKDREIEYNEEVEGIYYQIVWNNEKMPITFATQLQAMAGVISAQWIANKLIARIPIKTDGEVK